MSGLSTDVQIASIINGAEVAIAKLKYEGESPIESQSLHKIKPRGLVSIVMIIFFRFGCTFWCQNSGPKIVWHYV